MSELLQEATAGCDSAALAAHHGCNVQGLQGQGRLQAAPFSSEN